MSERRKKSPSGHHNDLVAIRNMLKDAHVQPKPLRARIKDGIRKMLGRTLPEKPVVAEKSQTEKPRDNKKSVA